MNGIVIAMLMIAVQNAGTGASIASHTLQGWNSLSDCQSQEVSAKAKVAAMHGGNVYVTAKCIDVSVKGKSP